MLWISSQKANEYSEYFVSLMRASLQWVGKSRIEMDGDLMKIGFKKIAIDTSGLLYVGTKYQTIELALEPSYDKKDKIEQLTFSGSAEIKNLTVVCSGLDQAVAADVYFDCYILENIHKTPRLARQIEKQILTHPTLKVHRDLGITIIRFTRIG